MRCRRFSDPSGRHRAQLGGAFAEVGRRWGLVASAAARPAKSDEERRRAVRCVQTQRGAGSKGERPAMNQEAVRVVRFVWTAC